MDDYNSKEIKKQGFRIKKKMTCDKKNDVVDKYKSKKIKIYRKIILIIFGTVVLF